MEIPKNLKTKFWTFFQILGLFKNLKPKKLVLPALRVLIEFQKV